MIKLSLAWSLGMDQGVSKQMSEQPPAQKISHQITQAVQHQYENFPFPPVPIEQSYEGLTVVSSYLLAQYARTRRLHSPQGKRALVAGCGTGVELHGVVVNNSGLAQVVGIDLSQVSIQLAQERIRHHRLLHCEARFGDLMDPGTLPEGPFDLISAYGVLHHTADPVQALQALAARLAPDGVMGLMLYNRRGRMIIYCIREVLHKLGVDQLPDSQKISFVRSLLTSFAPDTLFDTYAKDDRDYYRYDENIIDNFFHANDIPFDIAEIPDFLAQAGLEFIKIIPPHYEPGSWDPHSIVSPMNREFYQYYDQLSTLDQLSILELLNPLKRSENIFWCCHQGAKDAPEGFDREWFLRSLWQINPLFISHARISYLGRQVSFAELCHSDPTAVSIPTTHLTLHWPLLTTAQQVMPLSLFQLQHLLLSLVKAPRSGAEILADQPTSIYDHCLKCYQRWESYQIVVRI